MRNSWGGGEGGDMDLRFYQRTWSLYPGLNSPAVHNLRAKSDIVT